MMTEKGLTVGILYLLIKSSKKSCKKKDWSTLHRI